MKNKKILREIIKKTIENSLGDRLMSAYDVFLEKPDDIETIKKEVIENVVNKTMCSAEEIVTILDDLIKTDKSVISWIKLTRLYGGLK